MGWLLVVSGDDTFHREAIRHSSKELAVVGATGDCSARSLVRAVDVKKIVVDGRDDVGRGFLRVLGNVPAHSLPPVVVVGPPGCSPLFPIAPDVRSAIRSQGGPEAA